MKRFKCTTIRTDEYIIEFDEDIFNDEWIKNFKRCFYGFDSLEEYAEHIAQFRARFERSFIEGYGIPLVNGKIPWDVNTDTDHIEKGINIVIESEDEQSITHEPKGSGLLQAQLIRLSS